MSDVSFPTDEQVEQWVESLDQGAAELEAASRDDELKHYREEYRQQARDLRDIKAALHLLVSSGRRIREMESALAEAAREINCAGPIAHRIRILKQEHEQRISSLEADKKASEERMTAWLNNLREAMPGQRYTSPTGESIVGAAINRLGVFSEERISLLAVLSCLESR